MLVCWLIMSLAERLSSKFHICPRSFASRPNIIASLLGQISLSRGHYQSTYQPSDGVYLLNSLPRTFYLTIRLWARDFYEVIVDEAEGRINYRLIEIESEQSNCFSRILTEINADNGFQLFFDALLNFSCKQSHRNWTVLGEFAVVYARTHFFNIFVILKVKKP